MKFLHVYCKRRAADVYINLEKIILIEKINDGSKIVLDGEPGHPVEVDMQPEELVRKINGDDKTTIGFRTGR